MRPFRGAGGLLIGVVLAGVLAACGAGGFGADPTPPDLRIHTYVALGDGFTAAPYTGDTVGSDGCLRSDANYPALVAESLHVTQLHDVSCTRATTAALASGMKTGKDTGTIPPQFDALDADTDLVTLGMGIEDDDLLRSMFTICLTAPCAPDVPTAQSVLEDLDRLEQHLAEAVRKIQSKAPGSYIVLVGYPQITPTTGACDSLPRFAQTAGLDAANYVLNDINRRVQSVARQTGSGYVDVAKLSIGHELCSGDPWVHGAKARSGEAVPYHPLAAEQQAVAHQVEDLVESR